MNETPARPYEIRLRGPLGELSRKERRSLLGSSVIGIAIVKTGLVPTKVAALGIDFDKANQEAILLTLAFVVGYFLVAFLLYATADVVAWRRAISDAKFAIYERRLAQIAREHLQPIGGYLDPEVKDREWRNAQLPEGATTGFRVLTAIAALVTWLKVGFDYILPMAVGGYAAWCLVLGSRQV